MELGITLAEFLFFLLLSGFFCLFVVLPSDAVDSAGFTIPKVFAAVLGEERFDFVLYQMRRTLLTAFVHSALPFVCFVGLELCIPQPVFSLWPQTIVQMLSLSSLLLVTASLAVLSLFYANNWEQHPLAQRLRKLAEDNADWRAVAREINDEIRAPLLFTIQYKDCSRVLATRQWLLKVANYNVDMARIADSQLVVVQSSPLQQSLPSQTEVPFNNNNVQLSDHLIDLRVRSISGKFDPFTIRIRSQQELENLRDQLGRPIDILESLILPQPMHEKFVDAFLLELEDNPRAQKYAPEELEPCLGCSQTDAQIKLMKRCADTPEALQQQSQERCHPCACRPMWCARCMGRIFASKQNQQTPEIWMEGRAPCPTCRANFCVLDVCLVEPPSTIEMSNRESQNQ